MDDDSVETTEISNCIQTFYRHDGMSSFEMIFVVSKPFV